MLKVGLTGGIASGLAAALAKLAKGGGGGSVGDALRKLFGGDSNNLFGGKTTTSNTYDPKEYPDINPDTGAPYGIDQETGNYFDDTKRYVDALPIPEADKRKVFELNARRVFPRLDARLKEMSP